MEFDLHSQMLVVFGFEAKIHTANAVSAEVDTDGYESLEWVVSVGDALDGSFDSLLEESEDDGAGASDGVWTTVPAAETLGAAIRCEIADTDKVYRQGSIGKKRHQRLTMAEDDANTAGILGANAILSHPKVKPVADQST
jgi:hypothetical protein